MNDEYWIYKGDPDNVALAVPSTNPEEGGYILIVVLENGSFQVFATRFPGRSITGWKTKIKKFDGSKITSVLVSHPRVRHEVLRRGLMSFMKK